MARILGEERQAMRVQDPVSGSVITLFYRRPTSEERVAYQLSAYRIEGGERRLCLGETRLKFGLEILTGFSEGDFQVREDGQAVPLKLSRPLDRTDPFAVDAGGSASDAWAIDQASSWDENWDSRAYVY
jgi:hypothetical protein